MQTLINRFGAWALIMAALSDAGAASPQRSKTYQLCPSRAPGTIERVEAALEVSGENKVLEENKVERFKMSVLANVAFDEKVLELPAAGDRPIRAVRYYDKAAVLLKLESDEVRPTLGEDRRLVGVEVKPPAVTLFGPEGPLTQDELELLEMHGSGISLLVYRLLPDAPVAVGGSWKHQADLMAAVLDLDAVSQSDAQSVLRQVVGDTAEVEISGRVEGAVEGVSTEIEMKAKYHFSLSAGRISWFGMLIRENRSIGHVGPGVEALSRLQMKITPLEESAALSDAALAGLQLTPDEDLTLLSHESPQGGWGLVYDRGWYLTRNEDRLAVFRLVTKGELVAQCNIHAMDDAPPEEQVTLEKFQEDIRQALGESFRQFLQASQRAGQSDCRIYRVVAAGEVEQLPIQWIYYFVADKHGRQLVLVFTIESKLLEQFAAADEQLIAALRLDPPEESPRPIPAGN